MTHARVDRTPTHYFQWFDGRPELFILANVIQQAASSPSHFCRLPAVITGWLVRRGDSSIRNYFGVNSIYATIPRLCSI